MAAARRGRILPGPTTLAPRCGACNMRPRSSKPSTRAGRRDFPSCGGSHCSPRYEQYEKRRRRRLWSGRVVLPIPPLISRAGANESAPANCGGATLVHAVASCHGRNLEAWECERRDFFPPPPPSRDDEQSKKLQSTRRRFFGPSYFRASPGPPHRPGGNAGRRGCSKFRRGVPTGRAKKSFVCRRFPCRIAAS